MFTKDAYLRLGRNRPACLLFLFETKSILALLVRRNVPFNDINRSVTTA